MFLFFFFQAEEGIRDDLVTGVQTCALPICAGRTCVERHFAVTIQPPISRTQNAIAPSSQTTTTHCSTCAERASPTTPPTEAGIATTTADSADGIVAVRLTGTATGDSGVIIHHVPRGAATMHASAAQPS